MMPGATLLGLPSELRLQIYQEVRQEDIHHTVHKRWNSGEFLTDTEDHFDHLDSLSPSGRIQTAWQSLLLTCKTTYSELKYELDNADDDPSLRVCVLHTNLNTAQMYWRRIQCAPKRVEKLVLHVHIPQGAGFWIRPTRPAQQSHVPGPVFRNLFHTVNAFLHAGPQMRPECALPQPLHLKEIEIHIEDERMERTSPLCHVTFIMRKLSEELDGFVDVIHHSGDGLLHPRRAPRSCDLYDYRFKTITPQRHQTTKSTDPQYRLDGFVWGFSDEIGWPKRRIHNRWREASAYARYF